MQNQKNYTVYREIQETLVAQPTLLPSSQAAEFASFGFTNLMADTYWLQTIQYIGGNVISAEYKDYLAVMLNLITDLNPYFEKPYIIGELLLPSVNERYEDLDESEIALHIDEAETLGLKGVKNFCDPEKIQHIFGETDFDAILHNPAYQNPCRSYQIPYYLAYIYFYYKKDAATAADYYKVVAAQDDAPEGAKVLAAIMQGRAGEREKSLLMFLSLARSLGENDIQCKSIIEPLTQLAFQIEQSPSVLSAEIVKTIDTELSRLLPTSSDETDTLLFDSTQCIGYLAKSVRELHLIFLNSAQKKYLETYDSPAETPQILFENGYISYIPTDSQQYPDKGYGIIYRYNPEIASFDYEMGFE